MRPSGEIGHSWTVRRQGSAGTWQKCPTLRLRPWSLAPLPQDLPSLCGLRGNHHGEAVAGFQARVGSGGEFRKTSMQGEEDTTLGQRNCVGLLARKAGPLRC
jgi:hypothetical protein